MMNNFVVFTWTVISGKLVCIVISDVFICRIICSKDCLLRNGEFSLIRARSSRLKEFAERANGTKASGNDRRVECKNAKESTPRAAALPRTNVFHNPPL